MEQKLTSIQDLRTKLSNLSLEDLKEIDKETEGLAKKDKQEAAKYYTPNGKAADFIALVGSDKNFVNMFIGANGSSKTATGANILTNIIYGPQNDYFQHPIFKKWPYIKKGRIISDPTTLKEKIIPELKKWLPGSDIERLPEATYETAKEGKNYVSKFITNNGWEIDLMSNEQDVKEFESVDLGFVWIDEPMPKDRFMATIARGRLGMIMIWTFTPLTYSAWIKDWLDEHIGSDAAFIDAEMEDNCKVHGVRGFFEHAHIKRIADAYPEDEREARVFGKFGHLIGRVHKGFKRSVHVIKPFAINEQDWTTYVALDPHPRVPDHVLYLSVNKKGTKILTGEILSEGSPKLLYERIKAFEVAMHYRIEQRIIDPSAYVDDQHREEKSVGSQLFDMGQRWVKGSKDLMAGIKRTDSALDYEMAGGKFIRPPELFIFDNLKVTIKQLEEYVWSEYKGRTADEKKPKGQPRDINDHNVENLHRLLLAEPLFIPYALRLPSSIPSGYGLGQPGIGDASDFDPYEK